MVAGHEDLRGQNQVQTTVPCSWLKTLRNDVCDPVTCSKRTKSVEVNMPTSRLHVHVSNRTHKTQQNSTSDSLLQRFCKYVSQPCFQQIIQIFQTSSACHLFWFYLFCHYTDNIQKVKKKKIRNANVTILETISPAGQLRTEHPQLSQATVSYLSWINTYYFVHKSINDH